MSCQKIQEFQHDRFRPEAVALRFVNIERHQLLKEVAHFEKDRELLTRQVLAAADIHPGRWFRSRIYPELFRQKTPVHADTDLHEALFALEFADPARVDYDKFALNQFHFGSVENEAGISAQEVDHFQPLGELRGMVTSPVRQKFD